MPFNKRSACFLRTNSKITLKTKQNFTTLKINFTKTLKINFINKNHEITCLLKEGGLEKAYHLW